MCLSKWGSPSDGTAMLDLKGKMISIETFGASGTGSAVMELFGFTTENVVKTVKDLIEA